MKIFFVILFAFIAIEINLIAAEAGMPQLDPKYWASQAFWLVLVFSILYLTVSKVFIPKIKENLDDRDNKIKDDLDEAKNLQEEAEKKQKIYDENIENAKKEVQKILFESKKKLNIDIQNKKKTFEKEIDKEVEKAQKEITELKLNSASSIQNIAEEITSKIIENISGDVLNESSVRAAVSEISKKSIGKYL